MDSKGISYRTDDKDEKLPQSNKELLNIVMSLASTPAYSKDLVERIGGAATTLGDDIDPENERTADPLRTLVAEKCLEYSEMIGTLSTLAALLNRKHYTFGQELVEVIANQFKIQLNNRNWDYAERALIVLCSFCSAHLVSPGSLVSLLQALVEADEGNKDVPQARRDAYVYLVLAVLPYVAYVLSRKKSTEFSQVMDLIAKYMETRDTSYVKSLSVYDIENPTLKCQDSLDSLWEQIQNLKSKKWADKCIMRPYVSYESSLTEGFAHALPDISPPPHEPGMKYPRPQVTLNIFDGSELPFECELPPYDTIERFIVANDLKRMIRRYNKEPERCGTLMLRYPGVYDKLPLDYCITEVIFNEMFRLPQSEFHWLTYAAIMNKLCIKIRKDLFPTSVSLAATELIKRLPLMHSYSYERFIQWYVFQMNQFEFKWPWDDYKEVPEMDDGVAIKRFFIEVFETAVKTQFHDYLVKVIPPPVSELMPNAPEVFCELAIQTLTVNDMDDQAPKNGQNENPVHKSFRAIFDLVKVKTDCEKVFSALQKINEKGEYDENVPLAESPSEYQVKIFLDALCCLYTRTPTHMATGLTAYRQIFTWLGRSDEEQFLMLNHMNTIFQNHKFYLRFVIERLIRLPCIEPQTVAKWVLSENMKSELGKLYIWDLLDMVLVRLEFFVQTQKKKLTALQGKAMNQISIDMDDTPTAEIIEKQEDFLREVVDKQKDMFTLVFQRIIMLIQEYRELQPRNSPQDEINIQNDPFYFWMVGRLQSLLFKNAKILRQDLENLESLLFSQDAVDPDIYNVWKDFKFIMSND